MTNQRDELLTKSQTARLYHIAEKTLETWRLKGIGPKFVRLGGQKRGRIFYRESDVLEYLEQCTRTSTSDNVQTL